MRFSNKISKYSKDSVPASDSRKSPAEQWFVGGVFALSACNIGKAAGLLHYSRVFALFALWFFRLRTSPPALSPAWSPISVSGRSRLVRLIRVFRCKPARLHALTRPVYTPGSGPALPDIHAPAVGSYISAFENSGASALSCHASALETSAASTLHCHASVLETSAASALETSAASTLHYHASALKALAESALTSALPAPDVLIRTLAERAIWAWSPEAVRLCGFEVCAHSRSAGHSASPYLSAAATATPASTRTGKRFSSQKRNCQQNNDRCFDSCLFHFRCLSLIFHSTAFLSPVLGFFYRDSGAVVKKVTPGVSFSEKYQQQHIFTSMFRLSCKSGIKTKKNLQTG